MFKIALMALLLMAGCAGSALAIEHDHRPPHGGLLLEVGDELAHIELIHDPVAGKVTLYILGSNIRAPISLKEVPKLQVNTENGAREISTKVVRNADGTASQFEVTDDDLKVEPLKGRIAIVLMDKQHVIDIAGPKFPVEAEK